MHNLSHMIRFLFQLRIVIQRHPVKGFHRLDAPRLLLYDMAKFMGQMLLLAGAKVNLASLGIGQGLKLGRLCRILMNPYIIKRQAAG